VVVVLTPGTVMPKAGTVHSIAEGLTGLHDRPRSGRKPRLTPEQMAELDKVVEQGPDPETDGVVRWRRVDLQALIKARFAVELHERSVGKILRRLGFARLSVRPQHPSSDPAAQETSKNVPDYPFHASATMTR
jgi:transposase